MLGTPDIGGVLVDAVSKEFPGHLPNAPIRALSDVTFAVDAGASLGLIGPNGAGKSTMLKLIAGVTAPSTGRISRSGHTVSVIELGAGVHFDLTGRENMRLLTELHRPRRSDELARSRAIEEFSGLGDAFDRPVRQFSTGMIARLAFSVAVHCDPEILLVDEVLSVGDLSFQERCTDRITELRRSGVTVILVSHDLELVETVCARTILLLGGCVEQDGASGEVIAKYLGRPNEQPLAADVAFELTNQRVDVGDQLEVRVEIPELDRASFLRLEYVVPAPPDVEGVGTSIVAARARIPTPGSGERLLRLGTAGLPPQHYELHLTLEDAGQSDLLRGAQNFSVVGTSGPTAIRLSGSLFLDDVRVGAL